VPGFFGAYGKKTEPGRLAGWGRSLERTRLRRQISLFRRENTGNFIGFGTDSPIYVPKKMIETLP
jgi:hypothetical protein